MGIGSARGDGRALKAAEIAINSPLLEASMEGAQGVLMSIAGGSDLGLFEINEAASLVQDAAHQEANIIFGTVIDDSLGDEVRVTVIAAGFDASGPGRQPVVGSRDASTTIASGKHGKVSTSLFEPADAVSVSVHTNGATFDIGGERTRTSTCRPSCGARPDTGCVSVRVRRVTTTRAGGVSAPPFDTFNLGDHVGDDPAAVAANRKRLAAAIGLGADRVVWMNQVHGDRVEVVDGPRTTAVADTDALVTGTPRLALAVVTADCVPVLLADARAGVVAAVHAGRVGARDGVVARAVEAMVAAGAHEPDISALLGPAVSGRNYEVPAAMADEVEAVLPGSRTTHLDRHARAGPSRRNRLSAQGFGRQRHRYRPAVHGGRRQSVQSPPRRPDRAAGIGGVDGMSAVALKLSPRPERESELADALTALTIAARSGRQSGRPQSRRNSTAAHYQILSSNRCRDFVEFGMRRLRRIPRAGGGDEGGRSREVAGRLDAACRRTGTWWARSSATKPDRWPTGRTPPTRSAVPGWSRRSTAPWRRH